MPLQAHPQLRLQRTMTALPAKAARVNVVMAISVMLRECMACAAGDIQDAGAHEAGKAGEAEKAASSADKQALLQFLRMMRKGKVQPLRAVPAMPHAPQTTVCRSWHIPSHVNSPCHLSLMTSRSKLCARLS